MSVEEKMNKATKSFDQRLPTDKIEQVLDYSVKHGEYALALEILCDFIIEDDIKITEAELQSFKDLATEMEISLHDGVIQYLNDLIKT